MTGLERRALLGDKQAQEECTEKGILLRCPVCGGEVEIIGTNNSNPFTVWCDSCGLEFGIEKDYYYYQILESWNTRSAPPIGRCGECKHSWNQDEYGYINCTNLNVIMKQDDFCSLFEPKERTDEQIHNPAD